MTLVRHNPHSIKRLLSFAFAFIVYAALRKQLSLFECIRERCLSSSPTALVVGGL